MATMIALKKITAGDNIRRIEGVEDFLNTPLSEFPERERQTILSLASTIEEHGLLNPITVKDLGGGKKYRIIAGHRRFKAVQHLGKTTIDAKSVKGATDNERTLAMIENIQREDMNAIDVAFGLEEIMKAKYITKQSSLARLVGKSDGWVSQHLALLKADNAIQAEIRNGGLGLSAARTLGSLPKEDQKEALADAKKESESAGKSKISTKSAKRQVNKSSRKKKDEQQTIKPIADREVEQRNLCIKEFLDATWGEEKPPTDIESYCRMFWQFLLDNNRLIIKS
jgi:ParB family chromosome partitioning protein